MFVIFNALDLLKISEEEDTVKQANDKKKIARSILTELINNYELTVKLKKSRDAFRLADAD